MMLWEGENALLLVNLLTVLYRAMRTSPQKLMACVYRDAEHPEVPLNAIPAATQQPEPRLALQSCICNSLHLLFWLTVVSER